MENLKNEYLTDMVKDVLEHCNHMEYDFEETRFTLLESIAIDILSHSQKYSMDNVLESLNDINEEVTAFKDMCKEKDEYGVS